MKISLYKIWYNFVFFSFLLFYSVSCEKPRLARVETGAITDITINSAVATGKIIDLGEGIIDHGHCWSNTSNPTIADYKTSYGTISKTGLFTSDLQYLLPGIRYYVRAFAETSNDELVYGDTVSFRIIAETGEIMDVDGNNYLTVKIGIQWWIAENLKTTKYNDGTNIPNIIENTVWMNLTTPGFSWYNNDVMYKNLYGALYNWFAVDITTNGNKNVCPSGWHVPSIAEWTTLINFLGGESVAGGKLKEVGTVHWRPPNNGATNETAFTALPGGRRFDDGEFATIGFTGSWWSSMGSSSTYALGQYLDYLRTEILRIDDPQKSGFSIRCIKD